MKSAVQILKEARSTLSFPDQYTKNVVARDITGKVVSPLHPGARRWCSTGAVIKAAGDLTGSQLDIALYALQLAMGGNIPAFHDGTSRNQVLKKFDEAIALLEKMDVPNPIPPIKTR